MCDEERQRLITELEDAVNQLTLVYDSRKDNTDAILSFAVGSMTRRFGRLRAYEEANGSCVKQLEVDIPVEIESER